MNRIRRPISPLALPIVFFSIVIVCGAVLLHRSEKRSDASLSWTDSVFTSTSATCVTGLNVVDVGSCFTRTGHFIILGLMQAGGLGIMTFASLLLYLWRNSITITDRIAVAQTLLYDPKFHLGKFLIRIVSFTIVIELSGALLLWLLEPHKFHPFSAVFHAVSAFCNAGFALFTNSLADWKGDWGINLVFITLIFLGGIGFSVLIEMQHYLSDTVRLPPFKRKKQLSWHTKTVLQTSIVLILFGWLAIYLAEFAGYQRMVMTDEAVLSSLFQSITCRTAGFNTLDIAKMTNISLVIMIFLMMIGGAPGSCAGGLKVTTIRILIAVVISQLKGDKQVVVRKFAINDAAVKKTFLLFILATGIIFTASFIMDISEGGDKPHDQVRGQFLEILFESVSAFSTVGLSMGITPKLTAAGKWVLIVLMFIGRLGPLLFIAALQKIPEVKYYSHPQKNPMIG